MDLSHGGWFSYDVIDIARFAALIDSVDPRNRGHQPPNFLIWRPPTKPRAPISSPSHRRWPLEQFNLQSFPASNNRRQDATTFQTERRPAHGDTWFVTESSHTHMTNLQTSPTACQIASQARRPRISTQNPWRRRSGPFCPASRAGRHPTSLPCSTKQAPTYTTFPAASLEARLPTAGRCCVPCTCLAPISSMPR